MEYNAMSYRYNAMYIVCDSSGVIVSYFFGRSLRGEFILPNRAF